MLRNIAQYGVQTTHVFHCDIDFVPSKASRQKILSNHGHLLARSLEDETMLVIPAFELPKHNTASSATGNNANKNNIDTTTDDDSNNNNNNDDAYLKNLPLELDDAKEWYKKGWLVPFHQKCVKCQEATDLDRWSVSNKPYKPSYQNPADFPEQYEPYVIISNQSIYWNEHFSGYGRDKTLYFYELVKYGWERVEIMEQVAILFIGLMELFLSSSLVFNSLSSSAIY